MMQISLEWVDWLREKPHTGYEMAAEITRRIGNVNIFSTVKLINSRLGQGICGASMINYFSYNKLVGMKTIECTTQENSDATLDGTVRVQYLSNFII